MGKARDKSGQAFGARFFGAALPELVGFAVVREDGKEPRCSQQHGRSGQCIGPQVGLSVAERPSKNDRASQKGVIDSTISDQVHY